MSSTLAKRRLATVTKLLFAGRFSLGFAVRLDLFGTSGNISNKVVEHSETFVGIFGG